MGVFVPHAVVFLISGVFFSPERFSVVKSAMQLFVPFILFNIIGLFIYFLIGSAHAGYVKFPEVDLEAILHSSYPIGPSWFLLSLCMIRVFAGLILKYLNNWGLVLLSVAAMVGFYFTRGSEAWTVLSTGGSVLGLPFYLIGYYLKDIFKDRKHFGRWYISTGVMALSILAIFNGPVGIHALLTGENVVLFFIFGVLGTVALISLSVWIKIPKRLLAVFMDGALFFICMHTIIFEYLILCWNKLTGDFSGNTLTEKVIFTILTFALSYPLILLSQRYAPVLLGKRRKSHEYKVVAE